MSATKVWKALLHGWGPRFPPGIRALNRMWLEHPLSDDGMRRVGHTIPGYRETRAKLATGDNYLWIDRLTIRGVLTGNHTVEILFPGNIYDPKTAKVSLNRSIAFYAPDRVSDSDLLLLFCVIRWKFQQFLDKPST